MSASSATPKLAYKINEAATAVGISRSKLYQLIAAGELRKTRVGGRSVIRAADLEALLDGASSKEPTGASPNPP